MLFDGLWRFFLSGGGIAVCIIAVCTVGCVFAVTLTCGFFSREVSASDKRFFLRFAEMGGFCVTAGIILDGLSASSFGAVRAILLVGAFVAIFAAEYGILCVQAHFARQARWRRCDEACGEEAEDGESAVAQCPDKNEITPLKRAKTARIKEVLLRRTERREMERGGFGLRYGERYACDCISRLKGCELSEFDRRAVCVIEHNLGLLLPSGNGDKRAISENCGRLITLMAKYFK